MMRKLVNFVILLSLTNICKTWANKTKLCVEFRVRNSRWNHGILDVMNSSESGCLQQCARHPNCRAYNLWRNGTCELVRGMGECNETEEQGCCTYTHLRECTGRVPWDVGRRNWSSDLPCLIWKRYKAGAVGCPLGTLRGLAGNNCATVIPYKGLYLPGRYVYTSSSHRSEPWFHTVDFLEQALPIKCHDHAYALHVTSQCPTDWLTFKIGDALPPGAVRVSSWVDGSPVYLVESEEKPYPTLGYFLVTRQQTFISTRSKEPTGMITLVYVWSDDIPIGFRSGFSRRDIPS